MFDDNPQQPSAEQPQQAPAPEPAVAPEQSQQPAQPEQPAKPQAPAEPPVKTTQEERMWAAIGYVAFLGVVTLAMVPKSEFCKKHAAQGIVNFVIWFIGLILLAIPVSIVSGIGGLVILAATIIAIIGIVKSISSHEFKLPLLSDLAKMVPTGAIVGSLTGKTPPPAKPGTPAEQQPPQQPAAPEAQSQEKPAEPAAPEAPAAEAPAQEANKEEEKPDAPEAPQNPPQQ